MKFQRKSLLLLLILLPLVAASALGAAPPPRGPLAWCGTDPAGVLIAQARHDAFERRLARQRLAGRMPVVSAPTVFQNGQIAILEDDGTVTRRRRPFDLKQRGIQFLPDPQGLSAEYAGLGFKVPVGERLNLGDDDSAEVVFSEGFQFPFGGEVYDRVFVNSDGNLTFGEGEPASGRSLNDVISGPPRLAPLLTDLNPAAARGANDGVFVQSYPNRLRVTWRRVPEFASLNSNTFQVTLFSSGRVTYVYRGIDAKNPVVAVAPPDEPEVQLVDFTSEIPLAPRRGVLAEEFALQPEVDELGVVRRFFERYADRYTSVFIWLDFHTETGGFAFSVDMKSDVQGIGKESYDRTSLIPGTTRLETYVEMGSLDKFPKDPNQIFMVTASTMTVLGHEFGHRWLAFVHFQDENGEESSELLNFDRGGHWSYYTSAQGSLMHGNFWLDNGDGTFTSTADAHKRYSSLDLYLMGLVSRGNVDDIFFIADPDDGGYRRFLLPVIGHTLGGRRVDVSFDDIVAIEGLRDPRGAISPKHFRTAFVLVTLDGERVKRESIDQLDRYRRRWVGFFQEATGHRGTVSTALVPR